MCKYCNKNIFKREKKNIQTGTNKLDLLIQGDCDLEVTFEWQDNLRNATMIIAGLVDIEYCPWCGKHLTFN